MHAKERALAPAFRRVLGAEIVVPVLDTDTLGTFSGEVPRPDALVETALLKADMVFEAMPDVDCALASEGSYGPIDRVPLDPGRRRAAGLRRSQARHPPCRDLADASHELAAAALRGGRSRRGCWR